MKKGSRLKRLGRKYGPAVINLIAALIQLAIQVANYNARSQLRDAVRA